MKMKLDIEIEMKMTEVTNMNLKVMSDVKSVIKRMVMMKLKNGDERWW